MPRKSATPVASLAGIIGAVGGWTLSHYCGAALWVPGVTALVLFILFVKTPLRPKQFAGAIAITLGHVAWFLVASVVTREPTVLLDVGLLSAGAAWLWMRPALAPALALGLVQLASLVINAAALVSADFGTIEHQTFTAHCLFRVLALGALVTGLVQLRRVRTAPAPSRTARSAT